jgi:hypothetical protein
MDIAQLVALLNQLSTTMESAGTRAGDLRHAVEQLRTAFELTAQGYETSVNVPLRLVAQTVDGRVLEINRVIDVVAQRAGELQLNIENKTGAIAAAIPTLTEALIGPQRNAQLLADLILGATGHAQNLWRFTEEIGPRQQRVIDERLTTYAQFMLDELRLSEDQVRRAIESFRVEGAEEAFQPAIEFIFGKDGPIAQVALREASGSPDFGPAMQAIFGPGGALADAATASAGGADLEPALQNLEDKIEEGVTEAMEGAGEAAATAGAQSLSNQISSGVGALGNVLTSVPQLYTSVTALGAAWDKPLNSTQDYMNLFSALGATINQGVQVFQALQGVMQLATAAQAAFNVVAAMNPIVLIVLAVIALIAGIVLLIAYWDEVKAALRDNPWLAVAAVMFGLIGIIVVVIAYWDEIKLAVLVAANFISIQVQRIGAFFMGVGRLASMVWDYIVATLVNMGIGILNTFIELGTSIQNFFIGVINGMLELYNEFAESAVGEFIGLEPAELIPEVDVETRLIPPRDVPEIDVDAAFRTESITGGLEDSIAAQRAVVDQAQREDEARRAQQAEEERAAAAAAPAAPAAVPALPGAPALPAGAGPAAAAAAGGPDQSVRVDGGITVNINAERLEADAAEILSDEIIRAIQQRLDELRAEAGFRTGVRAEAA